MKPLIDLPFNPALVDPFSDSARDVFPSIIRNSNATSEDIQGNLIYTGRSIPRFKKNGTKNYLLLEPGRANHLSTVSEDFAKWTLDTGTTVLSRKQISPTGEYDADEVSLPATGGLGLYTTTALAVSGTVTFSVWIRTESGTENIKLVVLDSGTTLDVGINNFTANTTWTRVYKTFTFTTGTGFVRVGIQTDTTGASTVYMYGAQLETSFAPTSYQPGTPTLVAHRNMVPDGTMEIGGTAFWVAVAGATISKDTSVVKFGSSSMKVVAPTSSSGSGCSSAVFSVLNATSYRISVWIRREVGSLSQPVIRILDQNDNLLHQSQTFSEAGGVDGSWQEIEFCRVSAETLWKIKLNFGSGGAATAYIDNVQVIEHRCPEASFETVGTPPSPWSATAGTPIITQVTSGIHSGSRCMSLDVNATEGMKITQAELNLVAGLWYRWSCWVYIVSHSGSEVPSLKIEDHFNQNSAAVSALAKNTLGVWQRISIVAKTHSSITSTKFAAVSLESGTSCVFYLDDFSIHPLEDPTSTRSSDEVSIPLTNSVSSNMAIQSESIDNSVHTKSDATVIANDIVAPDGTTTADRITETADLGHFYQSVGGFAPLTNYVFSCWLKSSEPILTSLLLKENGGAPIASKSILITEKWTRFFCSGSTTAAPETLFGGVQTVASLYKSIGGGTNRFFWAWGYQIEQSPSSFPSRYIKTTTAQAPKYFTSLASHNHIPSNGSVSFFCVFPGEGISTGDIHIFGDGGGGSYLTIFKPTGGTVWVVRMKGLDKTGALLTKDRNITGTGALGNTSEIFVVVTWSTERSETGKMVQCVSRVYINADKKLDSAYTDIDRWAYRNSTFQVSNGNQHSYIRGLKIWPGPLTDRDVTDLYVAG